MSEELAFVINDAQRAIIAQQTPEEHVRYFRGRGGKQLAYVDHAYVTRTLNEAFGWDWDFEVDEAEILTLNDGRPFEVKCRGRLTIRTATTTVVKMQYGSQPIEFLKNQPDIPVSLGDAHKGAASDALKKCASLLGIALDLYDSDYVSPDEKQPADGWTKDAERLAGFIRWAAVEQGCSGPDLFTALGVEDLRNYAGTDVQAIRAIKKWSTKHLREGGDGK